MSASFDPNAEGPVIVSPRDESRRIRTVEEWFEWAPPLRGDYHWADNRSAKEVAKAWCRADGTTQVPAELQALLDSNQDLGRPRVATGIPESKTRLPDTPSGPRRHDLVLLTTDSQAARTLVGLEAKADEPFDASVGARVRRAQAKRARIEEAGEAEASMQIARIEWFCRTLLGREAFLLDGTLDPVIAELPYQLLAGFAGTLVEGERRGATQVAFVVHAFHSKDLDKATLAANDAAFARFVEALAGGRSLDTSYEKLNGRLDLSGGKGIPKLPVSSA
jgi:hypothetical protein